MLIASEAQSALLHRITPLAPVPVPLLGSIGCVLAEDIFADIDNPPFDNSAVDGFALMAADTAAASAASPVFLTLRDEVMAGSVPANPVTPGECIKVMTGATIPPGADAMVMVEDTSARGERIEIRHAASPGDHIRRAAEDIRAGDLVLNSGAEVHSPEVAMLAAMGRAEVPVIRRPRVAVISTGDEVIDIEKKPGPGQIRNSNRYALAALVAESGAELHSMRHLRDDERETEAALRHCAGLDGAEPADVIVTSGGVSVGERDFVRPALERLGKLEFWRVAMKPGKPIAFGSVGSALFFGLPGNPVSTMVTFELFVRPALRRLAGHADVRRPRVPITLARDIHRHPGREEFVRAVAWFEDSVILARPTGAQGSGILSSMVGANALLVLPPEAAVIPAGETLSALLLDLPRAGAPD